MVTPQCSHCFIWGGNNSYSLIKSVLNVQRQSVPTRQRLFSPSDTETLCYFSPQFVSTGF